MHSHPIKQTDALAFIFAGQATFTIKSLNSGTRFTYKITIPKKQSKESANVYWVSVLTGQNNESDYTYAGSINARTKVYTHGRNSAITAAAPSIIALNWVLALLNRGGSSNLLEIWHEGVCCRCGRKLTVPESIESGIGPECASIKAKAIKYRG